MSAIMNSVGTFYGPIKGSTGDGCFFHFAKAARRHYDHLPNVSSEKWPDE